jgi:hypothetical protein
MKTNAKFAGKVLLVIAINAALESKGWGIASLLEKAGLGRSAGEVAPVAI